MQISGYTAKFTNKFYMCIRINEIQVHTIQMYTAVNISEKYREIDIDK